MTTIILLFFLICFRFATIFLEKLRNLIYWSVFYLMNNRWINGFTVELGLFLSFNNYIAYVSIAGVIFMVKTYIHVYH